MGSELSHSLAAKFLLLCASRTSNPRLRYHLLRMADDQTAATEERLARRPARDRDGTTS